jgi:hypothetical protein
MKYRCFVHFVALVVRLIKLYIISRFIGTFFRLLHRIVTHLIHVVAIAMHTLGFSCCLIVFLYTSKCEVGRTWKLVMRVKRLLHWVCEMDSSVGSVTLKGLRGEKL